ncbi:unnamed protein product [Mycena citricolor]|uniref:Uncharacterized protein n=1 Tax=Mycena citricolor TaxID=2018698 RepID=A0AAD2HK72_9AGAR|nr:unnamed protein product [Mycena citricolor]
MCDLLITCSQTLCHLDYEGWAPLEDSEPEERTVTLPVLRNLRLAFIDDIAALASCIVAPALLNFTLHDVLFCPTLLPVVDRRAATLRDEIAAVFDSLGRSSCTTVTRLRLVGLGHCQRSDVDTFFDRMPNLTDLEISLCDRVYQEALFQPESCFRLPRIVFPILSSLTTTLVRPTDLARFLLRHKTLASAVKPLKKLDVTQKQIADAYARPGICSILAVVLEMSCKEGMLVSATQDPRIYVVEY